MKLITPPIASVPYKADAPSRNTSTRSMAANGMVFRSTAEPSMALLPKRRPLSSTRVLLAPIPRMSAKVDPPVPEPTELAELRSDWLPVTRCMISAVVVTPSLRNCSARRMVIGTAVSASTRRIAEPVTSTRSSCVVAGAAALSVLTVAALTAADESSVVLTSAACNWPALIPRATRYNGTKRCRCKLATSGLRVKPELFICMVISGLFRRLLEWPCEPS